MQVGAVGSATRSMGIPLRDGGATVVVQDGEVRFVGPLAEAILGRKVGSVVAELLQVERGGDDVFELEVVRPGGARRIAEIRLLDTRWNGAPARMAVLRDVTERRRAMESPEDVEVSAALARAGAELHRDLEGKVVLERLCELANEMLAVRLSIAFLWDPDQDAFVPSAAIGEPALDEEARRQLRLPRWRLSGALRAFEDEDLAIVRAGRGADPALARLLERLECSVLFVGALRRRGQVVGFYASGARDSVGRGVPSRARIAGGLARIASSALEKAHRLEEMELLQRARSEFVATMSHELRAPLHVITGFQSLLAEGDFGPVTDAQADALQRIGKSARQLLELIENTLNLNRIQAGRMPVELADVPATKVIDELELETRDVRACSPLGFRWEVPRDLGIVRTDSQKLKVVLKNLIGNAIKYTDAGSIEITARPHGTGVEIAVADTGIGISPEALKSIFEPFRQVSDAGERGGVGLGLHIVRRMLDAIGGTVAVESRPGVGSTFRVWIPGGREGSGETAPPARARRGAKRDRPRDAMVPSV